MHTAYSTVLHASVLSPILQPGVKIKVTKRCTCSTPKSVTWAYYFLQVYLVFDHLCCQSDSYDSTVIKIHLATTARQTHQEPNVLLNILQIYLTISKFCNISSVYVCMFTCMRKKLFMHYKKKPNFYSIWQIAFEYSVFQLRKIAQNGTG